MGDANLPILSSETAYKCMYEYLRQYCSRTNSDEIRMVLSDMSLLSDGTSADPAALEDWSDAIRTVVELGSAGNEYEPIQFRLSK